MAIGLFARTQQRNGERAPHIRYRDFWGARKREELLQGLDIPNFEDTYVTAMPAAENRFSFRPTRASAAYPKVTELCAEDPISGLQEMRRGRLIAIDRAELEARMAE